MVDETLVLVEALNTNIAMSVNTPYGATETIVLPAVVAQGDLLAPLEASIQVDNIAKIQIIDEKSREQEEGSTNLYKYQNKVSIPILGMMDDTATVTEAGYKTEIMNAHIVTHTANKMLQFNSTKCKTMTISKSPDSVIIQDLKVYNWKVSHDKNGVFSEEYAGKVGMKETTEHKYLGFVISSDASNVPNILEKKGKVAGISRNIINITKCLGSYTFECVLIYLKSMIRGTTLNASETYYNMKEKEYRMLESYEEKLLIESLKTGVKCPRAIVYLDLGLCPARFVVKKYKLNFLHHILNQQEESLMFRFFKAQMENPSKGDWVSEIRDWICDYEIAESFEEVSKMKKSHYEKIVNRKINTEAFIYLKSKIKSKGSSIKYGTNLEMQSYLKPNRVLTFQEQIEIFSYRSKMNEISCNFRDLKKEEELCICKSTMNNTHLYHCKVINNGKDPKHNYEDLLNGTLHQQKYVLKIMKKNLEYFRKITLAT